MPTGNGMAFILIQHLDPTHESMMVNLLAGHTRMSVRQVTDGMPIERDHLYIIPPGTYLAVGQGTLHLSTPEARHGARLPFDFLLQSLAEQYGQHAIAVRLATDEPHQGLARQWFRAPDVLALLPTERPTAGHGLALVWSLPTARADTLLALDDAAFELELMQATAGAAGVLRLAGARAAWPLALARAERVCGAGWVLLGDAAHRLHPLAGQGLNLGLADVAALARVVGEREAWRSLGDVRLLERYAREREGPTRAMLGLTDGLLQLFSHPAPWAKELRNRGLGLVNAATPLKRWLTGRALGL